MATCTPDKVSRNSSNPEIPAEERDSKAHGGAVARLLAKVSKWHTEYIDYQMENGVWRKLSL
jgi:hypothetical protein